MAALQLVWTWLLLFRAIRSVHTVEVFANCAFHCIKITWVHYRAAVWVLCVWSSVERWKCCSIQRVLGALSYLRVLKIGLGLVETRLKNVVVWTCGGVTFIYSFFLKIGWENSLICKFTICVLKEEMSCLEVTWWENVCQSIRRLVVSLEFSPTLPRLLRFLFDRVSASTWPHLHHHIFIASLQKTLGSQILKVLILIFLYDWLLSPILASIVRWEQGVLVDWEFVVRVQHLLLAAILAGPFLQVYKVLLIIVHLDVYGVVPVCAFQAVDVLIISACDSWLADSAVLLFELLLHLGCLSF